MTGPINSGAVLIGKRRRADSCNATAAPMAEGGLPTCEVKRQRIRAQHEECVSHWKPPAPHPDLWPVEHPLNTVKPVEPTDSPGDGSHMHYGGNFSHHARQALCAVGLATPATSPPSQGALSPTDDCEDEDMDQDMDEDDGDDASDIDPNSEYYHINMFLKRLHDEREMRRRQRLAASGGSSSG